MNKCTQCGQPYKYGEGVDHDDIHGNYVEFCSMAHFKEWVKEHPEEVTE